MWEIVRGFFEIIGDLPERHAMEKLAVYLLRHRGFNARIAWHERGKTLFALENRSIEELVKDKELLRFLAIFIMMSPEWEDYVEGYKTLKTHGLWNPKEFFHYLKEQDYRKLEELEPGDSWALYGTPDKVLITKSQKELRFVTLTGPKVKWVIKEWM